MRKRKLVYEIAVAFSSITIITTVFLTLVLSQINIDFLRVSAKEYAISIADDISHTITDKLREVDHLLRDVVILFNNRHITVNDKIEYTKLKIGSSSLVDYIAIYNKEGKLVDVLSPPEITVPQEIDAKILQMLKKNDIYYTEPQIIEGDSTLRMDAFIAWYNNEKLIGYLCAGIPLQWLSTYLKKMSIRRFGIEDLIYIVDKNGVIVAHSDEKVMKSRKMMVGKGIFENMKSIKGLLSSEMAISRDYKDVKGRKVLGTIVSVPSLGWAIVVNQPHKVVYATVRRLRLLSGAIGGLCLIFALVFGIILSKRISRPIEELTAGIRRVSQRDFDHPVQVKARNEIGDLAMTFNLMIEKMKDYREEIKKETHIRDYLQRYLPPQLVTQLVYAEETMLNAETPLREVTVLFVDITGFTSITESLPPHVTAAYLNRFFSITTDIIFKYGGTIDKFIGDCVMAFFGAPYTQPNFEEQAILAASEIVKYLRSQEEVFKKEYGHGIRVRVGIATGEVIVGNIGSYRRLDYTAIGNPVNLASRLQNLANPNEILIDEFTKMRISEKISVVFIGNKQIKGIKRKIGIYKVLI